MKPWGRSSPDNTAAYEFEMGADESPSTNPLSNGTERATAGHRTKQSTSKERSEVAAQLTSAVNDVSRKLEPYLASIDATLKGLGPCVA